FLSAEPSAVVRVEGRRMTVEANGKSQRTEVSDPIDGLRAVLERYKPVEVEGLPRFVGGAVGYVGYDSVRFLETTVPLPEWSSGDAPDAQFLVTGTVLVFDNLAHTIKVVANAELGGNPDAAYKNAVARIDALVAALQAAAKPGAARPRPGRKPVF